MARGINKVILVGNLGNDPEIKYTQGGMAITTLSLATTESRKDKEGNFQEKTEWHRVKLFGKTAEIAGEYLKKGRQVYIEGRIEYGSYEKDGVKHYTTDIIADDMQMLGGGGEGRGEQRSDAPARRAPQRSARDAATRRLRARRRRCAMDMDVRATTTSRSDPTAAPPVSCSTSDSTGSVAVQTWLVTGGAGFIGGNFVLDAVARGVRIINLDALTYAGNRDTLASLRRRPASMCSCTATSATARWSRRLLADAPARRGHQLRRREPRRPLDRRPGRIRADQRRRHAGAAGSGARLLARAGRRGAQDAFRFLHVSTDEVYGSLGDTGKFTEDTAVRAQFAVFGVARPPPTTWCARSTTPTACRC